MKNPYKKGKRKEIYFAPNVADYGQAESGYLRNLFLNVSAETGDLYYVSAKSMNGAGAWSSTISSRPIHVYGANTPGTVSDGRKVTYFLTLFMI